MKPLTLRQLAHIMRAETRLNSDRIVTAIGTDSRTVPSNALFFALSGEHFDGHDFALATLERQAIPVVARTHGVADPATMLLVDDPQLALERLASALRTLHAGRVVAITGSVGKTTVKDMVAAALSGFGTVARTIGNFNNHIGLPLTLAATTGVENFLVLELGMSAPGEIAHLTHIARPDVALVTCAAAAHLAFFESVDAIADAKGELYEHVAPSTPLVANADDPRMLARAFHHGRPITFGLAESADVRVLDSRHTHGHLVVTLSVRGTPLGLRLAALGHHQATNAAAAIAVVVALGLDPIIAADALSDHFHTPKRRLEIVQHGTLTVLDDCYNANPSSMRAALATFAELATTSPRGAVLGSMLELGPSADAMHHEVAVLTHGLDAVFCTGPHADALGAGAAQAGVPRIHAAEDVSALEPQLRDFCDGAAWLLLKGSRGMRLERVHSMVEYLNGRTIAPNAGGNT